MAWEVEYTHQFEDWWADLTVQQQGSVGKAVGSLIQRGPRLRFPRSSRILSSRHNVMRELRVQSGGRPLRVFYAFDPTRTSILLIGGDKTGDDRFYRRYVPIADDLYDDHLEQLRKEGLIE